MANVIIHNETSDKIKNKKTITKAKVRESLFIASIAVWPLLMFCVFWLGGNITRLVLAFQEYDVETMQFQILPWSRLGENFQRFFNQLSGNAGTGAMFGRSLICYGIGLLMMIPNLLISFAIYKKVKGSEVFKVIIFAPSIVSGVVWVLVYRQVIDFVLPSLLQPLGIDMSMSLFIKSDTVFPTLLFYTVWTGLGGGLVLYTGTFSKVAPELVEAGKVDGMNTWQEFWYISLPLAFPVISIGLFTGVVSIFTIQPSTFTFFGTGAPSETYTFGYYFFSIGYGQSSLPIDYPYAAACSIIFTAIAAPLAFTIKYVCEKYGPGRED